MSEYRGLLEISPFPGSKRLQAVGLVTEDTRYVLDYRAHSRWWPYAWQQVVIEGTVDLPEPHVQSVGAPHLRVQTLQLVSGEPSTPEQLPAPPAVRVSAQLEHAATWRVLLGTSDGAVFRLTDGAEVQLEWMSKASLPPKGDATVLAAKAGSLHQAWASCSGHDLRCGVVSP